MTVEITRFPSHDVRSAVRTLFNKSSYCGFASHRAIFLFVSLFRFIN